MANDRQFTRTQIARRHFVAMAAIGAAVVFARIGPAKAYGNRQAKRVSSHRDHINHWHDRDLTAHSPKTKSHGDKEFNRPTQGPGVTSHESVEDHDSHGMVEPGGPRDSLRASEQVQGNNSTQEDDRKQALGTSPDDGRGAQHFDEQPIGGPIKEWRGDSCGQKECSPRCFLKGTKIRTIEGERNVEDLAIGDLLTTAFGEVRPIISIGRYRLKRRDSDDAWLKDDQPIRVSRSAIGPNVPHTDLFLTYAHSLYIDGALVCVGSLINGLTIARYAADELQELEYFHVKLESHDIIYAEGAPSETLLGPIQDTYDLRTCSDYASCVPILSFCGGSSELKSRLRSVASPWFDRRNKLDIIRDRLEERALMLKQRKIRTKAAVAPRSASVSGGPTLCALADVSRYVLDLGESDQRRNP